jgi:hypothetical protein
MIGILRFTLFSSLLALSLHAHGQNDAMHIREENEYTRIALTDILGEWVWEHTDSTRHTLSFVNQADYCVIIPEIKHGVGPYSFLIEQDSMHVNGSAANWPPYYCTVRMVNKQTIELLFYTFLYPGHTTTVCRRK